jgi:hypothetical protein
LNWIEVLAESCICCPGRIEHFAKVGGQGDLDLARKRRLPGDQVSLAVAEPTRAAFHERPLNSQFGAHEVAPLVPGRVR